jgi:hypothetical protein
LYAPWGAKPFPWFEGARGVDRKDVLREPVEIEKPVSQHVELEEQLQLF